MTADTRLASVLIAFHVLALALAAVPDPAERRDIEAPLRVHDDAMSRALGPPLDRAAVRLADFLEVVRAATRPIRAVTEPYIAAGLPQRWIMFSHPWTDDQYLRLDHYVTSPGTMRPYLVVRELALPAQPEDRVRFVHTFHDKATVTALEAHLRRASQPGADDRTTGPSSLDPLVRYRRAELRAAGRVGPDDDVRRTDVWLGRARIPPPGERVDPRMLSDRLDLLRGYRDGRYDGPVPPTEPRLLTTVREGDLTWQLVYIHLP